MTLEQKIELWQQEETAAQMHGWDFSHLQGRYTEETDLPWDFGGIVRGVLRKEDLLLDMETGGGEFLRSLAHPPRRTSAIEGYPPNAALCRERLTPQGICFREADGGGPLPFADGSFTVVTNRHGDYTWEEVSRVLQPGGLFLTEQVGEDNDRELVELLLSGTPKPFPGHDLAQQSAQASAAGFAVLRAEEARRPIRFFDVGALVWFAKVLPWEFPGFSVAACQNQLRAAQKQLEREGSLMGTIHRFLLVCQKRR